MLFAADVLVARARRDRSSTTSSRRATSEPWIARHGGKPLLWKTGHSLIKGKMKETGAALAGEMSGHMFFKERWYGFDDGLYAGARLLEILSRHDDPSARARRAARRASRRRSSTSRAPRASTTR